MRSGKPSPYDDFDALGLPDINLIFIRVPFTTTFSHGET